ncbi:MAG: DNA-binding response regulator [Ignavibacteria bacterium]|nr:MAG: DNA-binding response regulator [Ignavibacteria bacterium]
MPGMQRMIDIVIADDHPLYKMGLRESIDEDSTLRIVGDAEDGQKALSMVREIQPDVLVLDLEMPVMNGVDVLRSLAQERESTHVIVLTMHDDSETFEQVMELGAVGYLLKDSAAKEIRRGIHAVAEGEYYISPSLSGQALRTQKDVETGAESRLGLLQLTAMERTVLRHISSGQKSTEIAEELHVSPRTVENHRANICRKLDLRGPYALLRYAYEHRTFL